VRRTPLQQKKKKKKTLKELKKEKHSTSAKKKEKDATNARTSIHSYFCPYELSYSALSKHLQYFFSFVLHLYSVTSHCRMQGSFMIVTK